MKLSGALVIPEESGETTLTMGSVEIESGCVTRVERTNERLTGTLILPGLVDAHLHLPQFDSIGVQAGTLLEWLDRVIYPAERRWEDPAYAAWMARRVGRQLLSVGTTAIAAYATVHHESTARAIEELGAIGIRGHVGQVLMDREAAPELLRPAERLLDEAARLRAHKRIAPSINPRFAISCSPELLAGAGELARHTGWLVQTHLAETEPECLRVRELFNGAGYLDVYADAGLVTPKAIFAHAIWLSDGERAALGGAGAVACHCPTANSFLGSGEMAFVETRRVARVALGSDVAGGPDRSMVRVARAAIETSRRRGTELRPSEAWWHITRGNADALGLADAGRIEPGAEADLLVVEPDLPWHESPDPLGTLLHGWDDRWLRQVVLRGNVAWVA